MELWNWMSRLFKNKDETKSIKRMIWNVGSYNDIDTDLSREPNPTQQGEQSLLPYWSWNIQSTLSFTT